MKKAPDPLAIDRGLRIFADVHERLRLAIITGHFPPGSRFVERELTDRLRVSRTPIREALKRLEQEGLVVCYPYRGWFVRSPSFDEARQAYEMRRVAEGVAGELAAQRATDEELAAFRSLIAGSRVVYETGDRESMLPRNNEFHELQARVARNVFLEQHLRTLWAYVDLLRGRAWVNTDRATSTQREHEAIVAALSRRDAALARRLNEEHVDQAWAIVSANYLAEGPPAEPAAS
jgi:DNA-binding GntR family transcriptional regulator